MEFDFDYLVSQIKETAQGLTIRLGMIVTVNSARTVDIRLAGSAYTLPSVKYMSNYAPLPNSQVWVMTQGSDMWAVAMLAGADRTLSVVASATALQTLVTATESKVTFGAVDSDSWSCWAVGNATRLTAPITGRYLVTGQANFIANATGIRALSIFLNNTTQIARQDVLSVSGAIDTHMAIVSQPISLAKGDYVELRAWQNSGGNLNISGTGSDVAKMGLLYLGS